MILHQLFESSDTANFDSSYAEQLAQEVFDHNPNISNEDEVLNLGYEMAKNELGSRAQGIFRDADFPSDFVSAYYHLKKQGVAEDSPRVDSLVTDALKIMRGPTMGDAVAALKTVLGEREYNGRRGFYNFYIKQILDMYSQQGVAEASPYSSRNPDTMSSNEYDRYQQDQMDYSKRDFKRREHEHEWEQEKAYSDKLAARDGGSWYIRINGKILKDKQQQPYTFQGKAAANKAALTMMAKAFNKGKKFTLTTSATDAAATQPIAESAVPSKPKHRRW